jgi:hypothetical protein
LEGRELQRLALSTILCVCGFFFSTLSSVVKRYPNLFEGEEGSNKSGTFGWLSLVDRIAGGRRTEWDKILEMPLIEFLNTLAYYHTIQKEKTKRLEKAAVSGFENYVCACLNELI